METFTWRHSQAELGREPKLLAAKFGDGYEQRAALGLLNALPTWELTFEECAPATASAMDDFLTARAGHEAFLWVSPKGLAVKAVCKKWRLRGASATVTVSANFEEVIA